MNALRNYCDSLGCPLSDHQVALFEAFKAALYERNQVKNLTRIVPEECEAKHFLDSLLFVDLIPSGAKVADLGTGPGLPAWPIACARPDVQVTAIDSNGKMLDFLRTQPLPNLVITQGRAEELSLRDYFDVVTGRALAPLGIQLEVSAALISLGGVFIPLRSESDRELIEKSQGAAGQLGLSLDRVVERQIPGTDLLRLCPVYVKTKPTPDNFPRMWATIQKRPLIGR